MRKTIKALILSGLVFPGMGHLILKKHLKGFLLSTITIVSLVVLLTKISGLSSEIATLMHDDGTPFDPAQMNEMISQNVSSGDSKIIVIPVFVIFICWIYGVLDSFRIARIQDNEDAMDSE